ncbi:hypothetical protein MU582_10670 [Nocardioidaceae bacterium SCSIO 66511]|nr:hypothetical protein MU582_10670 [Nocardioidaceae bacterium SCSIO 66511]
MAHYEYYPATSGSVRGIARQSNGSADAIAGVESNVESDHRAAISEAAGDAQTAIKPITKPIVGDAAQVKRRAIWSACQLEKFADAIDKYNKTSSDPRSIDRLNKAFDKLTKEKKDSGGRALDVEKGRLDTQIDDAAEQVANNLDREPTDAEVRLEWRAGNLPASAVMAFPGAHLKLGDLPPGTADTAITEDGLKAFTDGGLADVLADPDLNSKVRDLILDTRQGAVDEFAKDWKMGDHLHPGGNCNAKTGSSMGRIIGPDGRVYDLSPPGDGTENGWDPVMSKNGSITVGDDSDPTAFLFSPYGPNGDYQSIGPDQEKYLHDALTAPPVGVEGPLTGPIPDSQKPPPIDRMVGASDLVRDALEKLENVNQAEANRHYASQISFQENEDGSRRAVITTYQVQSDGEDIRVKVGYATLDPESGHLEPMTP